ncbi:MAG: AAA family ATPase [Phycisphaerales bacterium]|nr:AAA family ATPase [Phycisphaerales bacterium]
MPDPAPAATTSPFKAILDWSATCPDWQRDALRRIVTSGVLGAEALRELAAICRAKHGLSPATGAAPIAVPLTAAHTPGGTDGTASVSLSQLSGLQNVGRLPGDQEIVFGDAPGLTVIYGENGAGKSGYARVIKKACRARGTPQDIKPDAFAATATGPAKAKIGCRVGTADIPVDWTDGSAADPRLGNIFVFDSLSARVHVGEDGPACFKPRGLDVLPELAKACDTINDELKADLKAITDKNLEVLKGWTYKAATKIGTLVNAINADTDPARIEAAALFNDADEKRLAEINATLSTDPRLKAADTTAAAKRIRTLAEAAKNRATSVDDTAMLGLGESIREAETTAKAAKAAAGPELKDGDLPGSCNEVWRKLWDAAKAYSVAHAYPNQPFPVTEADAKCVLCQQTLQPEAIDRYARFNKFVADETRKQAEAAEAKVADLRPGVDSIRAIGPEAADIKADLDREAAETFAVVEAFAKAVDARIAHAQKCLKEGTWSDAPALLASPCAELVTLADSLDRRAIDELTAADPEKAKALATERDELADKKWLKDKKEEVKAQIARHAHAATLKKCQDDCTTNAITIKSGELHESHVTAAFCKAFEDELAALGMRTVSVTLDVTKGAKGERKFGVRLVDKSKTPPATVNAKVDDIASEGEHRCIALAAFMAELSQASHKSALVFDDPVSSLDHARRSKVAKRLVKEAIERQVIVFTHDIVFLCELFDATEGAASPVQYMHLCWNGDKPGFCQPGLPWDWKKYTDRIDALEKEQRRIATSWSTVPNPTNVADIRLAYTRLSATLERIVQDVILNGVIGRYRDWVRVEKLEDVAGFSMAECAEALRIDKKCSSITCRHDPAAAKGAPVPEPSELLQDLNSLKALVEQVKARRKAARAVAPPVAAAAVTEPKPTTIPAPRV